MRRVSMPVSAFSSATTGPKVWPSRDCRAALWHRAQTGRLWAWGRGSPPTPCRQTRTAPGLALADAIHIGCQLEGPPNGGRQFGSRLPNLWSTVVARAAATQRVTYQEFFLIGAIARTGKATAALAASRVMRDRVDARRTPLDIGHSPKCLLFIAHRCKFLKLSLAHLCLLDRSVGSRFDSRCAVRIS